MHQHFRCCLAGCVWIGWCQNASLQQIICIVPDLTIDLICRDVDELLDSDFLCAFQQNVCAINVSMCEGIGVTKAQIHMRLRSEMEDGINVVSLQAIHNLGWICNVAMVECKVSFVVENSSIVEGGTIV